ncbi:cytochrome B [Brumimicrobium salinarum]|uniref:Cytochrome B n=1 Tax=Brumimicrobium salinarum TaxID=2058658 RepID=A0A2I0R4E9_9FLAO|nr:cytochrome B [Brumimicrobium salinarum]PKR81462.1 cytochrome B [Brumimicrobium salinarum]
MKGIIAAHSGLRYIVLALLVIAIFNAIANLKSDKYEKKDKMINLFAMIFLHIQLLLGLVLYFMSPKVQFVKEMMGDSTLRFFTMEHILLMLVAIILVTLGRKKAEKNPLPSARHKLILRYYGLGLIIIFISIPWPFIYNVGADYF